MYGRVYEIEKYVVIKTVNFILNNVGIMESIDKLLKYELDKINASSPRERIPLHMLLESPNPKYYTKDPNTTIDIDVHELQAYIKHFDPEMYKSIRLPLVFLHVQDIYKVSGSKIDEWIVEKLLGYVTERIVFLSTYESKHQYYYTFQINRIKKQYSTLIQVVYSM